MDTSMTHRRSLTFSLLLALLLLILAACSGGGTTTPPTAAPGDTTASPTADEASEGEAAISEGEEASPLPESEEGSPSAEVGDEEIATAGEVTTGITEYSLDNPPPVPNTEVASQYSGQTITYYGDLVGIGAQLDEQLAAQFTEDTGIRVTVVPKPEQSNEMYVTYQRFFAAQSPDLDVMMVDIIHPGAFAPHLVDLSQSMREEVDSILPPLIENSTIDGAVVTMPWFADFGILYYRTDLLEKYGFDGPPETWQELQQQAQTIQDGERNAGNPNFFGYVFQGNADEGLTCNALEWLASNGAGTFVDENGQVTVNSPQAATVLNMIPGFVRTISPQGVVTYTEDDARLPFQNGNAAFMRNWPYAYALAQREDSTIQGRFGIAPLPHGEGQASVGTVGGWGLGVSRYSDTQEAAIEFVRYLTSPEVQRYRAVVGGYLPTNQAAAQDAVVRAANPPLLLQDQINLVARPSRSLAAQYNRGSTAIFQSINQILSGQDAAQVLPRLEQQLQQLTQQ